MSVEVSGSTIRIVGNAAVSDAETLLTALHEDPARTVDLGAAGHLHSAVIQLLLALRPTVSGQPSHPFLAAHVIPLLDPRQGSS